MSDVHSVSKEMHNEFIGFPFGLWCVSFETECSKRAKMLKYNSIWNIFFGQAKTKTDHPVSNIIRTEENRRYQKMVVLRALFGGP